jgi:hypothetical protein
VRARIIFETIFKRFFLTAKEREWLQFIDEFTEKEMGYAAIQQTKPQTLGVGLTDSPGMFLYSLIVMI